MDAFDTLIQNLPRKEILRLRGLCICADCPTYTACAGSAQELLYCIYGRSFHCVTDDLGCICPGCPVVDEVGLLDLTFCILGSEASQRYGKAIPGS